MYLLHAGLHGLIPGLNCVCRQCLDEQSRLMQSLIGQHPLLAGTFRDSWVCHLLQGIHTVPCRVTQCTCLLFCSLKVAINRQAGHKTSNSILSKPSLWSYVVGIPGMGDKKTFHQAQMINCLRRFLVTGQFAEI